MKRLFLLFIAALSVFAQSKDVNVNLTYKGALNASGAVSTRPVREVTVDQTGACTVAGEIVHNTANGKLFHCISSIWTTPAQGGVSSVNGATGVVTVSTTSLGAAEAVHVHGIADVTDLSTTLGGKAASTHAHAATDVTSGQIAAARGGTGADLSATTGVLKVTAGAFGAVTGTATDCVKVDGTSGACGGSTTAFQITRTGDTTLSVNGGNIVVGTKMFTVPDVATCTLTATATDTAYFYLLNGTYTIGLNNSSSTMSCSGWVVDNSSVVDFPDDSTPIGKCEAIDTVGVWDTDACTTDWRTVINRIELEGIDGVEVTQSASTGKKQIKADSSVSRFTSGTSAPGASCTVGQKFDRTDTNQSYECTSTDTWTETTGGSGGDGLADPGANGIIKRTALNTTAAAIDGTDYVSPSGSATLTNKILDVEGTGNQVTTIDMRSWSAAKCQNGAAGATANLPATYSPTPVCITGTNVLTAGLTWPDADGDYSIQDSFRLPFDWSGYVNFYLKWRTSATSGDIVWQLSTACVADGETSDPSFNTAQTVTDTAKGSTLQENDATISSVTMTGCSAGETLYWKLLRNRTHASDTLAAAADLLSYAFRIRRMQ